MFFTNQWLLIRAEKKVERKRTFLVFGNSLKELRLPTKTFFKIKEHKLFQAVVITAIVLSALIIGVSTFEVAHSYTTIFEVIDNRQEAHSLGISLCLNGPAPGMVLHTRTNTISLLAGRSKMPVDQAEAMRAEWVDIDPSIAKEFAVVGQGDGDYSFSWPVIVLKGG